MDSCGHLNYAVWAHSKPAGHLWSWSDGAPAPRARGRQWPSIKGWAGHKDPWGGPGWALLLAFDSWGHWMGHIAAPQHCTQDSVGVNRGYGQTAGLWKAQHTWLRWALPGVSAGRAPGCQWPAEVGRPGQQRSAATGGGEAELQREVASRLQRFCCCLCVPLGPEEFRGLRTAAQGWIPWQRLMCARARTHTHLLSSTTGACVLKSLFLHGASERSRGCGCPPHPQPRARVQDSLVSCARQAGT